MSDYSVVRLEDVEEMNDGRLPWRPVAARLGITAFGATTWTAANAGDRVINEHDETEPDADEELYVVMRGRATFELDGERVDAPAGTLVFARPGVKRTAFAVEAGTTIIAVGGVAGKAYEPRPWSVFGPLYALYQAGEYDEASDRGCELLVEYPEYAGAFYNVACCESLAGRTGDALDHLERAVALSEGFRALATGDADFDPIRDEPRFVELTGA